jgi:SPP1 gp7 family putative phage head morphogenesis protein
MPVAIPRNLRLGLIEPKDAIAAFERKHLLLPSFRWEDVYAQEHTRGVAVAGVMKWDVLQAFADEIALTIADGGDLRAFSRRVQAVLEKKGMWGDVEIKDPITGEQRTTKFDKKRLELIFDVNTRQAYSTGRWKRIEANKARQPFVMYRTMDDGRVRLLHSQWHGLVLPVESPFWDAHYPPNGWRCRCTAFAVSEKDIARFAATGMKIKREAPSVMLREYVNKRTGSIEYVPEGIDPGFEYNPGKRLFLGLSKKEVQAGVLRDLPAPTNGLTPMLRMPAPRPVADSMLMEAGLPEAHYLQAFFDAFKNEPEFADVMGDVLLITDELFKDKRGTSKAMRRSREQYTRLVALAIQQPDEIWMLMADKDGRPLPVLRKRYIARFNIVGQTKPIIAVYEEGQDGWQGITGYQADTELSAEQLLARTRTGERMYVRVK